MRAAANQADRDNRPNADRYAERLEAHRQWLLDCFVDRWILGQYDIALRNANDYAAGRLPQRRGQR